MSEQSAEFQRHPRDGVERLVNEVRALRREVSELRNNTLKQAGVRVEEERLRIESELLVTGDTRIEGTLSLPAGIIDNDALANPVRPERALENSSGPYALGTTETTVVSLEKSFPPGFTKCLVLARGDVEIENPFGAGGPTGTFGARVYIEHPDWGSSWGARRRQHLDGGYRGASFPGHEVVVEGTPGSTITVRLVVVTGTAWGASDGGATISAAFMFSR